VDAFHRIKHTLAGRIKGTERQQLEETMSAVEEKLAKLRRFNAGVRSKDKRLDEESADVGLEALEVPPSPEKLDQAVELESIILRRQRPVLAIKDNKTQLVFLDEADSEIWKERLTRAKAHLDKAIRSVGRINLKGSPLGWVGTGWLVADGILVTNRHVANEFAMRNGEGFAFKIGDEGPMSADADFLQEIDSSKTLIFKLVKPLHIEPAPGPDISFFEIEMTSGASKLATPIDLALQPVATENVATIGYPAYDSRIPDPDLMERIYGKIYNKKRLAPGGLTRVEETRVLHNCTTLGGNSGSVVLDLDSGKALGLHFSGSFLTSNYAVRSDVVRKLLSDIRSGQTRPEAPVRKKPSAVLARAPTTTARLASNSAASVTIPLTLKVTVSLGAGDRMPVSQGSRPSPIDAADLSEETEAVPADYDDRDGYEPAFLGKKFGVGLPSVERDASDVLDFQVNGKRETELRYEHFSVVMSRRRRMCFFSAVNIDGNLSKKNKRVGWKIDPRIPKKQQIMNECYGSPPKFSRGHMTRREDPGWGDPTAAKRGNQDSMHVTNATPQMQAFNAPIWLALEDYALGHAKEDDMKISVFTGPYFDDADPQMFGVRIPVAFWKVIAFIHDDTGKLCATGYEMNQEKSLPPEDEFVFGAFTSPQLGIATQVAIRSIEQRTGISFGKLAGVDPLANDDEAVDGGKAAPLQIFEQIRFV
jgi:endonuclease G, mitochondrial